MQNFLEEVARQCLQSPSRIEDFIFVLPSKRAGSFLKSIIAKEINETVFAPSIFSIESFVERISGLEFASGTRSLFELYQAYLDSGPGEPDSFYVFTQWGQTLLQDFNEIDRYLVNTGTLFSYLADVKKIEQWTGRAEKTDLIEQYLQFWNTLGPLYSAYRERLYAQNLGYQGMVYREACRHVADYIEKTSGKTHIFIGFNALNKAESTIIQRILEAGNAHIYWDIDQHFLDDRVHDAGFFIRQHLKNWPYLASTPLKGISTHYKSPKKITIAAVPKDVAQAKFVGHVLHKLRERQKGKLGDTAVVLGDEGLLNPVLHSIPGEVESINITMGFPLENTPLDTLFSAFFEMYLQQGVQGWFYRQVLDLLSHPFIDPLFMVGGHNYSNELQTAIKDENWLYITSSRLQSVPNVPGNALKLLFFDNTGEPKAFTARCRALILALKEQWEQRTEPILLEQLYRFYTLFNQLDDNLSKFPFITDLKSLYALFRMLLTSETVDFRGEPMEGLQLMGMLESRNLDFGTVILTSVNEGILPSGKSSNSFIPHDLKKEFGLPTYKEKDAVYTYHFYRLLQRAKEIYLVYNTEPDALEGGEKSRFISQLLNSPEASWQLDILSAAPRIESLEHSPETVYKDADILEKLKVKASRGFSPTSLAGYIKNPIDFYKKSVLGIDEALEVDETITTRHFGIVIHGVLEDLYKPFKGQYLDAERLREARSAIRPLVREHFARAYTYSDMEKGKNLIAYEVVIRYIERVVDREIEDLENHSIKIIDLERKIKSAIEVPGLEFPVYLHGVIDRVDLYDGQLRILDYKTGNVQLKNVEITDWENLITNYDHYMAFQLLCYSSLITTDSGISSLQAGIISIRNLNAGILPFATREKSRGSSKDSIITGEVIKTFHTFLGRLLAEIFNPEIPFVVKDS